MLNTGQVGQDLGRLTPLLIVWFTAAVILIGDAFVWRRNRGLNPLIAAIGVIAAAIYAALQRQNWDVPVFAGSVTTDALATISAIALLVTALLSILLAWTYLRNRGLEHGEYYVLLLLSVSGGMLMAAATDLIMVFLGLEVLSFALYVLAGFARTEGRSEEASLKYFLLGAFASAFLLYGIALVYGATGTTNLTQIGRALGTLNMAAGGANAMLLAGVALLLVGLGFKAAVIPFHQWTPDVYEGAPTSVTAFMAGAAKIGAFAAILRVFGALIPVEQYWAPAIRIIAVLTMVFGNLLAMNQSNVKRMLAYSSIAHAGYLLVAVAALAHSGPGQPQLQGLATSGALFYLFAYVFMTLGAFGVLVVLSGAGHDYQNINDLRGLARTRPLAAYSMLFFMLSLGGIPPTMGFWGKWEIFQAGLQAGEVGLAVVLALTSVVAVFYYLRIVYMMTFEEPEGAAPAAPALIGPARLSVGLSVLATILFGIVPGWLDWLVNLAR